MDRFEKIAVSIPAPLVAKARQAVKQGEARSVSAYIADAVEQKTMRDELEAMLDEWLEESGGPPTEAELRRARRKLAAVSVRSRRGAR